MPQQCSAVDADPDCLTYGVTGPDRTRPEGLERISMTFTSLTTGDLGDVLAAIGHHHDRTIAPAPQARDLTDFVGGDQVHSMI